MAREPIQVIKEQLGNLMAEIAVLSSELEKRDERIKALEAQLSTDNEKKEPGKYNAS